MGREVAVGSGWCVGIGVGRDEGADDGLTVGACAGSGVGFRVWVGVGLGEGDGDGLGAGDPLDASDGVVGDGLAPTLGIAVGASSTDGDGARAAGGPWTAFHAPTAAAPTHPDAATSRRMVKAADKRIGAGRPPVHVTRQTSRRATAMAPSGPSRTADERATSGAGVGSSSSVAMMDAASPARGATSVARANRSNAASADRARAASAGATGFASQGVIGSCGRVIEPPPRRLGDRAGAGVPGGGGSSPFPGVGSTPPRSPAP